jgi:hypothetical protein
MPTTKSQSKTEGWKTLAKQRYLDLTLRVEGRGGPPEYPGYDLTFEDKRRLMIRAAWTWYLDGEAWK